MGMVQTMRWFGPQDPVSLMDIRQAGCSGVVTALHQIPVGDVWPLDAIEQQKQLIEAENAHYSPLHWAVVESLPVHEAIKKGLPDRVTYIDNYNASIRNLAACSIKTVCYNFMPVLDWSRTNLSYEMPDGSRALRFVGEDFAVFDLCILKRPSAEADYHPARIESVNRLFKQMTPERIAELTNTILLGLPGSEEPFTLDTFQGLLNQYATIDDQQLRENLYWFINEVAPVAQEMGVHLCIHPDDPPYPLLGLPRVVSTEADLAQLMDACPLVANGITFCTGSLGVRADNDLTGMVRRFGDRIHFVHLRTTKREDATPVTGPGNFHEADHLAGDVDMYAVVKAIVLEQQRRVRAGIGVPSIPMRPDHGHQMLDDLRSGKPTYPGYSAIGRLRGLAELRGLELGITRSLADEDADLSPKTPSPG
ncbi:MAG: mannonate dehydratase [Bacteroidetes bacterium]|nr:mannonate dehydratase [Fibrella sp.]